MTTEKKIVLIPLHKVKAESKKPVVPSGMRDAGKRLDVLEDAQRAWFNMWNFRKERERNKRYTYGKQWDDVVVVDGIKMTEEEYIKRQGSIPLKNNLIRRLVRNVLGTYRSQAKEPTCVARDRDEQIEAETMSTVLQCNMQLNQRSEIDARGFEEFMISGLIVQRKWYGWRNDKLDCWTDYVQPSNFIIDSKMRDVRGWDCQLVGELHDISVEELFAQFADTPQMHKRLSEIYLVANRRERISQYYTQFGYSDDQIRQCFDFLCPQDYTLCRVIEVWRKEVKPRFRCHDLNTGEVYKIEVEEKEALVDAENAMRIQQGTEMGMAPEDIPLIEAEWFMDSYWYYYYLTPFGDVLKEGETPYNHKSHPYVFKCYPYIDGEIHSFVADFIDQQRYVNRLITLYDWIMRSSAKGLLLFPEDCKPEGMDISDVADEWARFNGVIVIKKGAQQLPQQIANNCTNIGITELLQFQLQFMEEISGVNGPLQGKPGKSGMSAALYSQQTQNATVSLLDLLDAYSSFIEEGAYKDVKNIQQYYTGKRYLNIAGKNGKSIVYDSSKMSDIEFDLAITESTSTPAYRELQNDFLMQIWQSGQITIEQLLENGNFPFADQLLQSIRSQREAIEQGQQPAPLPQNVQQQIQANPSGMNMLSQAMG